MANWFLFFNFFATLTYRRCLPAAAPELGRTCFFLQMLDTRLETRYKPREMHQIKYQMRKGLDIGKLAMEGLQTCCRCKR